MKATLALMLLSGSALWAGNFSIGIQIGRPAYGGYYAVQPPPPPPVRFVPRSPGKHYVWVPGYWVWTGNRYAWQDGFWTKQKNGRGWRNGR